MNTPMRTSSIHHQLQRLDVNWQTINQMPTAGTIAHPPETITQLGIADLSCLTRFGVKGAHSATWLEQQEIPIPAKPNTWCSLADGGLAARLGLSEFLIEDSLDTTIATQLAQNCQNPPAKVYPVLRQDLAIALCGSKVNDLLLQTCNINFQSLNLNEKPVILTSMIGVSVTVIPREISGLPFYRIWCDYTFGNYFWHTLLEIIHELGGNAIGIHDLPPLIFDN